MLVVKEKYDEVLNVSKNNIQSLSDFWVDKIIKETNNGDTIHASHIITLKKEIWGSLKKYEDAIKKLAVDTISVDSLKTMQIIQRNTAEIKVLKNKIASCKNCDNEVLQKMVDMLQNQKNEAVQNSNHWVRKVEPKKGK